MLNWNLSPKKLLIKETNHYPLVNKNSKHENMSLHNFAAYKSGTFATDISNLTTADRFFEPKDMPAFIHEYCHYIQDTTTISSIFGFSLWMRDLVAMTKIFSNGEGKTISIPLDRDEHGETINKYRKFYNLYCGDSQSVFELDYSNLKFQKRHLTVENINLDGRVQRLAVNEIELRNHPSKLFFGLIVLQEMQAFYAQKMAEMKLTGVEFSVKSDNLPSYPYKFGDFLFKEFDIEIDIGSKFLLIDLCLDTVQATSVFLEVLLDLKGKKVTFFGPNATDFVDYVNKAVTRCSYTTESALENILPDLKMWAKGDGRKYLTEALDWYVNQVEVTYGIKKFAAPSFFSMPFCMDWKDFALFFQCFPSPVYLSNGILMRTTSIISDEEDQRFVKNYEAATTIWSHRILYDFLCSESIDQIHERCQCPLYENCHIRPEIGDDYTCKTAPWEIIKNEKQIFCQYGMAAHSFGLWQNTLDIKTG